MFTKEQEERIVANRDGVELIPARLKNHSVMLLASILEDGRGQRFFSRPPSRPEEFDPESWSNAVRELRWEGFVDIDSEDVDDDGIPDDVMKTGWKTNDSGIEFLRRLKEAAGLD